MLELVTIFVFLTVFLLLWPWRAIHAPKRLGPMLRVLERPAKSRHMTGALKDGRLKWLRWIDPFKRLIPYDPYSPHALMTQNTIQSAGLEGAIDPADLHALKWVIGGGLGSYVGLVGLAKGMPEMLLFALAFAFIGAWLPHQWLMVRVRTRQTAIQRELPQMLISLAVTTDAGLSFLQALQEVANRREGVLAAELRSVVQAMSLGMPQREALEQMALRLRVQELTLFVSVLVQTMEKGASGLSQLLREQAEEAWQKRKSKARELGEKASVKLFLPLILLTLPAMMIFLITPAFFSIIRFFSM